MVRRHLSSAELAGDARVRLPRRLAAICDAMKAAGAGAARIGRRLDSLLADIDVAAQAGMRDSGAAAAGTGRRGDRTKTAVRADHRRDGAL